MILLYSYLTHYIFSSVNKFELVIYKLLLKYSYIIVLDYYALI